MLTVKATPKYTIFENHCLAFSRKKGADMIEAVPLTSQWQPKNMQGFFAAPFKTAWWIFNSVAKRCSFKNTAEVLVYWHL